MATLPGGISSLFRRLPDSNSGAFKVSRSQGAWIYDTDGNAYVDVAMAMGATILGHAHPAVVSACAQALLHGPMPGFSHDLESFAADSLIRDAGEMQRATFVTTGSEAVHLACRIARKATGRAVVAKIAGGFDGWYDDLALGWSGSPEARFSESRPLVRDMTLVHYNDIDDIERLFVERSDIAAILIEPMLANAGSILSDPDYNHALVKLAHKHGAFVISDEVLMGLRMRAGPSCYDMGLVPDLITMGKAIGSGVPVAAVLGTSDSFAAVEDGRALRAGTYHGNPLVTAAVLATMDTLSRSDYPALLKRVGQLRAGIEAAFRDVGIAVSTSGIGSVFSLWFSDRAPRRYEDAVKLIRPDWALKLHLLLRKAGVVTIPGPWARIFVSFAHGDAEIAQIAKAYRGAARSLAGEGS
jgi:glutamate-1-semialdehyde 2,1-aminomutase